MLTVPEPSAVLLLTRIAPWLIVTGPVQPALDWVRARTPVSFFVRPLEAAPRTKGVLIVSVLPSVTSIALLAWLSVNVREVAKVPVARKPALVAALTLRRMPLPRSPSAVSLGA